MNSNPTAPRSESPTPGSVIRNRHPRLGQSCAVCVDNVAAFEIDVATRSPRGEPFATGPVPICRPCLDVRVEHLGHDLESALLDDTGFRLGRIERFEVRVLRPETGL